MTPSATTAKYKLLDHMCTYSILHLIVSYSMDDRVKRSVSWGVFRIVRKNHFLNQGFAHSKRQKYDRDGNTWIWGHVPLWGQCADIYCCSSHFSVFALHSWNLYRNCEIESSWFYTSRRVFLLSDAAEEIKALIRPKKKWISLSAAMFSCSKVHIEGKHWSNQLSPLSSLELNLQSVSSLDLVQHHLHLYQTCCICGGCRPHKHHVWAF